MSDKAILIVDDEAQIRDAFKMAFEQVGYSTYYNGYCRGAKG